MTAQPVGYEPLESTDSAPIHGPTHEEIEERAYHLWQERLRHGIQGTAEDDWFEAERELTTIYAEPEP